MKKYIGLGGGVLTRSTYAVH